MIRYVLRGGPYFYDSFRDWGSPENRYRDVGFRLVARRKP